MKIKPQTTYLYRNFGWNEYESIKSTKKFLIHPNNFQGKQFWIGKTGLLWWLNSPFAKPFTAKIKIPSRFVTPGTEDCLIIESDASIDGFPGGTVLSKKLDIFNQNITIEWFEY